MIDLLHCALLLMRRKDRVGMPAHEQDSISSVQDSFVLAAVARKAAAQQQQSSARAERDRERKSHGWLHWRRSYARRTAHTIFVLQGRDQRPTTAQSHRQQWKKRHSNSKGRKHREIELNWTCGRREDACVVRGGNTFWSRVLQTAQAAEPAQHIPLLDGHPPQADGAFH